MIFQATVAGREVRLSVHEENGRPVVQLEDRSPRLDMVQLSPHSYSLLVDGQSHHLSIRPSHGGYLVDLRQRTYHVHLRDELEVTIDKMGLKDTAQHYSGRIAAPIPGLIASISVDVGDQVNAGDQLMVLEAMKMENEIAAPIS